MNLRNAEDYSIGIDLGTNSVGWCVTDSDGELYHIKGKPAWGARLFPAGETAETTRTKRSQRRRYARRRERIDELQRIFAPEMDKVDPEFFVRMNQSRLFPEDRNPQFDTEYDHPFFNDSDFSESEYYDRYPTIWHLRKALMESTEKTDIRLVYLALHNIVKHRGHFLQEDNRSLRAANADAKQASAMLAESLSSYFENADTDISCSPDSHAIAKALDAPGMKRADRVEAVKSALGMTDKVRSNAIAKACLGYKVEFSRLFFSLEKAPGTSLAVSEDDKVEEFLAICPDDARDLFDALYRTYSAYVLARILQGHTSLSDAFVSLYEDHKDTLAIVKGLFRKYLSADEYREMFRGPKTQDGRYDINRLVKGTYTSYILGDKLGNGKGTTHEEFVKHLDEVMKTSDALVRNPLYKEKIEGRILVDETFLAKQRTRANGAIPMQLQLEEMERIIDAQGKYYPFLEDNRDLLLRIVSSRIPYYVGPLNNGHDPDAPYPSNPVDERRKFAWSVRKPGMEHAKAHPWNVEEVIDKDATAELFIRRMTGTCTYLYGEPVLPKCSLLYEEFCVLNELNGARWAEGPNESHRFSHKDREDLIEEVFKERKTVTHDAVIKWLEQRHGATAVRISGTQGETAFTSKLGSYNDFRKLLRVDRLSDDECPLSIEEIEQIILWSTVFEDRDILERRLIQNFGDRLDENQIKRIVKKRYRGWGRLSRKLLDGLHAETNLGKMSIIEVMREGNPTNGEHLAAMNFMEVLRDKHLGFEQLIDEANHERSEACGLLSIEDLPGSPAVRRTVNQAMRVIDELVGITKKPPKRICIEVTRDDDQSKKGKRTKSRYSQLEEALKAYEQDAKDFDPDLWDELKENKELLDNDRLVLYFAQCGKSLYSGRPLDIRRLNEYQIDHILPRAYIKDDSLDNRALVLADENQKKLDSLLLDREIVRARIPWWRRLFDAGLISEKKFRNLTRTEISDRQLEGFLNRQLVETSQIVKFARQLCEQRYPSTEVVSVRASLGSGLRRRCGWAKCREINDFHHAHDAFLACQMARFVGYRYPDWQNGFDLEMVRRYVRSLSQGVKAGTKIPGESGFIVDSFLRSGFDKETGEVFKDQWDAEKEVSRIHDTLNYKDCFISQMTHEKTGAFWKETIYSPRDKSNGLNLSVPLKEVGKEGRLDPRKYGGAKEMLCSYFFIFSARNSNGNDRYYFKGVPKTIATKLTSSEDLSALENYAASLVNETGCSEVRILRKKILFRQKLLLNGTPYILYGSTNDRNELRPATEIASSCEFSAEINSVLAGQATVEDEYRVAKYLLEKIQQISPHTANSMKIDDFKGKFCELNSDDRTKLVRSLAEYSSGVSGSVNFSVLRDETRTRAGSNTKDLASQLENIIWVDQSVTGIFERKTTFKDLVDGI